MKKLLLATAALLVCASCGGQRGKKVVSQGQALEAAQDSVAQYRWPAIPATIAEPEGQAEWLARHFWDNFDFTDTLAVAHWSAYVEQAFVDYTYHLLPHLPRTVAAESLGVLFGRAGANKEVFEHFAETAEKYLYDPNSPYRDEESYITVLRAVLANPSLDEWERIRPTEQLRMALKNRVGMAAADFRYTLASGASGTLYGVKAPYTLLFINNPGCPACAETIAGLKSSSFIERLTEQGTLAILALYPDGDLVEWRRHATDIPRGWINGYDKEQKIKSEYLYDLRAIPTMYLLDSAKRVILKDVTSVDLVEETIYNLITPIQ